MRLSSGQRDEGWGVRHHAGSWRARLAALALSASALAAGVGLCGGIGARAQGAEWSAGPLIQTMPLTLEPGEGLEAGGPFYYRQETEDSRRWGLPPLISVLTTKDGEHGDIYVLPPLFAWHRWGGDRKWQVLQLLSGSNVDAIEAPDTRRFQLFPFFFRQDSPDDTRDYWALVPFYGKLKNRLFRDEAEFVMLPLWLETHKGSVRTRNVLFPFLHLRDGPGIRGWQFFPLAGHEHLVPSTRTNLSDEVEIKPGHDKTFALWPIWFRNRVGLGTTNEGRVDAVLPLWYAERTPARDHTSVLWPFGSRTEDRTEGFRQWNFPWPLVGFARGEGKTLDRVLPLFSVGHTRSLDAQTYLWPLYRRRHLHTPVIDRDRWQLAVVLYSDLKERNLETGKSARRIDAWPFFTWSRDVDGRERLQALAVVEPFSKGTGIRRNWSPVWSLWRDEHDPGRGMSSRSILWNLYRRESGPGRVRSSLLFGLVRSERTTEGTHWRWFGWPRAKSGGAEVGLEKAGDTREAAASPTGGEDVPKHR